jgi:hypothetical protein
LQGLLNDAQEDAQHQAQHCPIALHVVAQPLGHRQHPLAHRQAGEDMVGEVRRRLSHAPGIAREGHTPRPLQQYNTMQKFIVVIPDIPYFFLK